MNEFLKNWILCLTAAGFLAAGAQALVEKGRVAAVLRLSCGLVLMLALLYPLIKSDITLDVEGIGSYRKEVDRSIEAYKKAEVTMQESLICSDCEEYISEQAAVLGFTCSAKVSCRVDETGTPIPVSVILDSSSGRSAELMELIESNLGIPKEAQSWSE